jgi:hypothetical protein
VLALLDEPIDEVRLHLRQRQVGVNERRKLVRRNGRWVVEAFPGEKPTTDEDVRNALDQMASALFMVPE